MLPTVAVTAAFPVPTAANPSAVFQKERLVEAGDSGDASSSKSSNVELRQLRSDLAKARNENRAKVSEDYRRRQDLEACKRKWRAEEAGKAREEKNKELELLGLPHDCAYLLDTAAYATRQYRENAANASAEKATEEAADRTAMNYSRAVKRLIVNEKDGDKVATGAARLQQDLLERQAKNVKRSKPSEAQWGDGVNAENARFLKVVEKTTSKDARAQMIKQNLERGTAL